MFCGLYRVQLSAVLNVNRTIQVPLGSIIASSIFFVGEIRKNDLGFIAQRVLRKGAGKWGPSEQLKQIIQTEHNIVKNPSWSEEKLAIFKDCNSEAITARPRCLHECVAHRSLNVD